MVLIFAKYIEWVFAKDEKLLFTIEKYFYTCNRVSSNRRRRHVPDSPVLTLTLLSNSLGSKPPPKKNFIRRDF